MFQAQSPINQQFKAKRKGILLMMPKKPINKNQGGMDRSEIHGIDFRFSTFGGGSLVWWQN